MNDHHLWFRSRVVARSAGLLDPEEEDRFEEHHLACADCRGLRDAFDRSHARNQSDAPERSDVLDQPDGGEPSGHAGDGAARGHIPIPILARWRTAKTHLGGLERALVLAHLESCADCRGELLFLGEELPAAPEVEAPAHPARRRSAWSRHRILLSWLGGGIVGAAAGIAVLLVLWDGPKRPGGVIPWGAPVETRGENVIAIPEGGTELVLAIPPPVAPSTAETVVVEVLDPDGTSIVRDSLNAEMLRQPTIMLLLSSSTALPEGEYTLLFRIGPSAAPGTELERRTFRVRTAR